MSNLDREHEILALADELGLLDRSKAVEAIVGYCQRRVELWAAADGPVSSIQGLSRSSPVA